MKNLQLLIISLLLFAISKNTFSQENKYEVQNITIHDFAKIISEFDNAVIIDVRYWKDYRKKRIKNALFAEKSSQLKAICDTLDYEQPILLYCDFGDRSITASDFIIKWGFQKVYNLKGGFKEWQKTGFDFDKKRLPKKNPNEKE